MPEITNNMWTSVYGFSPTASTVPNADTVAAPKVKKKKLERKFKINDEVFMTEQHDGWITDVKGTITNMAEAFNLVYCSVNFLVNDNYWDSAQDRIVTRKRMRTWVVPQHKLRAALYEDGLDNWE
jgi:hypothetical protein